MLRRGACVALGIAVFVACGSDYDSQDNGSADAGSDAPTPIPTATSSSGSIPVDGGPDVFKEQDVLPCEGRATNDAFDVFVRGDVGIDGPSCGTRDAPCKTVGTAITRAYATGKPKLVIAAGTYPEAITLNGGLVLEGAWSVSGTAWTPICGGEPASAVTIKSTTDTTVKATLGASVLRFLTLASKEVASPAESLYGVVAIGPDVRVALADSVVSVAAGGQGPSGDAGTDSGAPIESCSDIGDGGTGANGPTGDAGAPGTVKSAGFVPANGTAGGQGSAGQTGVHGSSATLNKSHCVESPPGTCTATPEAVAVDGGTGGCGGAGGLGGYGGWGGGSSIGIIAVDAQVVTYGGRVTTAGGGGGGAGGGGAQGGPGRPGMPGPATTYTADDVLFPCAALFDCPTYQGVVFGPDGGPGGAGGQGGQGGGGPGGWSLGYVKLGKSAILASTTTVFTTGDAGAGGPPNGGDGLRQQQWP